MTPTQTHAATTASEIATAGLGELHLLLHHMAAGRSEALSRLWDLTAPVVFQLAASISPDDQSAAEEVTLQVYLTAWQKADSLQDTQQCPLTMILKLTRALAALRSHSTDQPPEDRLSPDYRGGAARCPGMAGLSDAVGPASSSVD